MEKLVIIDASTGSKTTVDNFKEIQKKLPGHDIDEIVSYIFDFLDISESNLSRGIVNSEDTQVLGDNFVEYVKDN